MDVSGGLDAEDKNNSSKKRSAVVAQATVDAAEATKAKQSRCVIRNDENHKGSSSRQEAVAADTDNNAIVDDSNDTVVDSVDDAVSRPQKEKLDKSELMSLMKKRVDVRLKLYSLRGKIYVLRSNNEKTNETSGNDFEELVTDHCNLAKPVQELVSVLLYTEALKKAKFSEWHIIYLPLWELSKKKIMPAINLMKRLQSTKFDGDKEELTSLITEFDTILSQDFDLGKALIGAANPELIKPIVSIFHNIMNIELAFYMQSFTCNKLSPIEAFYNKLKTTITVLDKESSQFAEIKRYVDNSQAGYNLSIEEVFIIELHERVTRFNKFHTLPNHMLLWHGSLHTNFSGILSEGLRTNPKVSRGRNGGICGKGIYLADRVGKAANYCGIMESGTGLMVLCEAALGDIHEVTNNEISRNPVGKHSVKVIGRSIPDMSDVGKTENGAVIPYGKTITTQNYGNALEFNEFVFYDAGQVRIKYLVKMGFN